MKERWRVKFGSVCTNANVAIIQSGINPTILCTVEETVKLNWIR